MKVNVLFFGMLNDAVKNNKLIVDSNLFSDTESLKKFLTDKYPELKRFNYLVAVNQNMTSGNEKINDGDEIALLPPFSGG